jgi:hypothetical protein
LDNSDDNRIEKIDPTAGRVIHMDESLHRRWKKVFGEFQSRDDNGGDVEMLEEQEDNPYLPFALELDWRIAQWVIKDGPGQNSFDHLLKIPGVCQPFNYKLLFNAFLILIKQVKEKLGLSYHNTRSLHQILDDIPSYIQRSPDQTFTIRHRDIIESIRSLWGDSAHAKNLVYAPRKVFTDNSKTNRVFSEMWTAKWWNTIQVTFLTLKNCFCISNYLL